MRTATDIGDDRSAAAGGPTHGSANASRPLALRGKRWDFALLWAGAIALFALLVDGTRPWEDAILFSLLIWTTGGGNRSVAFVLAVLLSWASEPSLMWPTYWVCCTPLAWAWRSAPPGRRWLLESFLCGVLMCWLGTPFIRDGLPANGLVPHLFGCSLFGLQWVAIAAALRLTGRLPAVPAAVLSASAATGAEVLQALYGLPWVFMALALPAAPTPLAQWARWLTIFGVSFLLYLVNFLWLPDPRAAGWRRWLPPAVGLVVAVSAWIGGVAIASRVRVEPLPFRALIVQPYSVRQTGGERPDPEDIEDPLQTLTAEALQGRAEPDLIVWPEACRPAVPIECYTDAGTKSVPEFFRWPSSTRRGSLLLGALTKAEGRDSYNSACLVRPDGSLDRHDKLALVWLTERLPPVLDFLWFRSNVLPRLGVSAPLRPGAEYAALAFTDGSSRRIPLDVSICYEMYFPWLPQYRRASGAEAVVHITSETGLHGHPFLSTYENWTCQYRAIETRRWQLLCTTMGNSAVIDPSGALTASTNRSRGVLLAGD